MLSHNRIFVIILEIEVMQKEGEKVGEPKNVEHEAGAAVPSGSNAPASTLVAKPPPPPPTAPAPTLVNSGSSSSRPANNNSRSLANYPLYPIEQLSPYQNKWTIKARCTAKSDIRVYSTQRGDGKLFNVTLADETGEIRATAFNAVVDDLFPRFEVGKVYFVSKGKVNIAKKKFGGVSSDFEIGLEKHTEVEEVI